MGEAFKEQLVSKIISFYQEQYNRDPTVEEIKESMKKILLSMQGGDGEEEEREEEEEEKPTEQTENEKSETKEQKSENTEEKQTSENDASKTSVKRPLEDSSLPEAKKTKTVE